MMIQLRVYEPRTIFHHALAHSLCRLLRRSGTLGPLLGLLVASYRNLHLIQLCKELGLFDSAVIAVANLGAGLSLLPALRYLPPDRLLFFKLGT